MKKGIFLAISFLVCLRAAPAEEKLIRLGGASGWDEVRESVGIAFVGGHQGYPAISLSTSAYLPDAMTDLLIHFDALPLTDDAARYEITKGNRFVLNRTSPFLGAGCAAFDGPGSGISVFPMVRKGRDLPLFSQGSEAQDLSMEFWLYPANLENGEEVVRWDSTRLSGKRIQPQSISCAVVDGRLEWRFVNVFVSPFGGDTEFLLRGLRPSTPRRWTHHQARFDSSTGMLEYLADGKTEDVTYANASGREDGVAYQAVFGASSPIEIGRSFVGFMDEFRIGLSCDAPVSLKKYRGDSGRVISDIFDLSYANSRVTRIDARIDSGGSSGVEFTYRAGERAETWTGDYPLWIPFKPGTALASAPNGRYLQIGFELYPDGKGTTAPSVSDISIRYIEDRPPAPPAAVMAVAGNGKVALSWKTVPENDVKGYMIYYGYAPGDYFGTDASLGPSPVDVGNVPKMTVEGLKNGKLYYFSVTAYDGSPIPHVSGFSPETFARPSKLEK